MKKMNGTLVISQKLNEYFPYNNLGLKLYGTKMV